MSDEVKLLPCPFCGNAAVGPAFSYESGRWDVWQIECGFCDISIETPGHLAGDEARQAAMERWNTRAIEATRPTDEVVELLLEFVADQFDDGTRSDEYWDWLNNEIATRLGVGPDASERRRNIIECENCGKTHDRRQSCARAAIAAQQVDHD